MSNKVINKNLLTLYSLAFVFILFHSTGNVSAKGDKSKSGDKVLKESAGGDAATDPKQANKTLESKFGGPDNASHTNFLLPSGISDDKIRASLCKKGDKECMEKMKTDGAKPKSKEEQEKEDQEREKEKEKVKEMEALAAKDSKGKKKGDKEEGSSGGGGGYGGGGGGGSEFQKPSGYQLEQKSFEYKEHKKGKDKDHKGDHKGDHKEDKKHDRKHGKGKEEKENEKD